MTTRWTAKAFAALAVLALAAAAPVFAQGPTRHYYTELYRYPQGGFPTSATLDLTFRPDGTLVGYYHQTDGSVMPVQGSISGSKIALDIGGSSPLHVTGTLERDGRIVGRAFRSFGRALYSFVGRPIPNDSSLPRVP
ncbi:MAG TPA: hypothetical protein VMV82_06800 [Candidatus Dormibacteraeota bacterium]|nr:hypothetical protein [Candidatus Dormibacteraeota bacterium]